MPVRVKWVMFQDEVKKEITQEATSKFVSELRHLGVRRVRLGEEVLELVEVVV